MKMMKPWQAPSNKTPSKRSNKERERERERERTQVRARKTKTQSGSQRGIDGKKKTLQMNDAKTAARYVLLYDKRTRILLFQLCH
jgi:hypothetical protein